jgi:N-methylhydantoinase A/oxoprolinase/acetone carboxylase beta subunit
MIIGLDVGGTHTDVVLINNQGIVSDIKVPTDSSNLFSTVLTGLESITKNVDPSKIQRVVLSTTLTTNAIVQKKVPDVGMIVSGGPGIDPEYFRTGQNYYPVSGSIDHRGREVAPIDEVEIKTVAKLFRSQGIRHVGIVGKFSVRNPVHENQIKDIIENDFEKIFLGHQISGHLNFPRRIATTFLNASVYPIHIEFFKAVKQSLVEKGIEASIRILKADGGNMRFESSVDVPGQTILSGPAASVMGAVAYAKPDLDTLVLDIGGTTTDMTILTHAVPILAPLGIEMGPYKTLIRSLNTRSLGVGGDSQVFVKAGNLEIGPNRRGPAMAFGGPVFTPTDALFVLGKMNSGDRDKANQGIMSLASKLGKSTQEAAEMIFTQACQTILLEAQNMVTWLNRKPVYTIHEIREGVRIKPSEILVLGGPAQFFAERFQDLSKQNVRVVPSWSVANAMGAALARTTCEVSLFADTAACHIVSPSEDYQVCIQPDFDQAAAVQTTFDLLRKKALERGADPEHLEMELLETQTFNMVRGFQTTGRDMRVRAQVKPGLIQGYADILKL